MPRRPGPDWKEWLRRWDLQQESFNPERDLRFHVMFDVIQATVGRKFRALDLGSGPGSLSSRMLRRFPAGRSVAVDYDPVALAIGRGALGTFGGRLNWVDTRLGREGWAGSLPPGRFDAALSTTALHWLTAPNLRRLYSDLHRLLRPRGVFLNGDWIPWGPRDAGLAKIGERVRRLRYPGRLGSEWVEWRRWWEAAERVPELKPMFQEQARRQAQHPRTPDLSLDVHVRALRRAGFRTVGVFWQNSANRILLAQR